MNNHLKRRDNDLHFGLNKTIYNCYAQVLCLTGPLNCLWVEIFNTDAKVKREDMLSLVQWILVLLGVSFNSIILGRR